MAAPEWNTSPECTNEEHARNLLLNYHLAFQWNLPFPQYPSAPLLYPPPGKSDVFKFPRSSSSAANVDIDAMSTGLVDAIPLCPPPVTMDRIREMSRTVRATAEHTVSLNKIHFTAREGNPLLCDEDFALVDTELDKGILESRSLPSLRSLMKPTYTEIGLIPAAARADAREERLNPQWEERVAAHQALREATPMAHTPTRVDTLAAVGMGSAVVDAASIWQDETRSSFRHANNVDADFFTMLRLVATRKLGLAVAAQGPSSPVEDEALTFVFCFLRLLFQTSSVEARQSVWSAFRSAATSKIASSLLSELAPFGDAWTRLGTQYAELLMTRAPSKTALPFGRRKEDGGDGSEFADDGTIILISNNDLASLEEERQVGATGSGPTKPSLRHAMHPSKANVYAVDVLPVLPSHFVEASSSVAATPLAGDAQGLTRVVYRGLNNRRPAPHVLVQSDGAFLEGTSSPNVPLADFGTIAVRSNRHEFFSQISVEDGISRVSTSAVLMQLQPATAASTATITALSLGERRVAIYQTLPRTITLKRALARDVHATDYIIGFDASIDEQKLKQQRTELQAKKANFQQLMAERKAMQGHSDPTIQHDVTGITLQQKVEDGIDVQDLLDAPEVANDFAPEINGS